MKDNEAQPVPPERPEKAAPKPREAAREKTEGTWAHLVRVRKSASIPRAP